MPLFPVALAAAALALAEPPRQMNAGELERAIERLGVVGNVLYIAAHPDDENTRLLAYLVGDKLLHAAYLSVTRGDGGQNLIGSEQGPLLGLIRTQELLAARRIDGADQFFTRARDFGYSKTPDETLAIWGRDEVLADMVWVIRRYQPDLIVSRFPSKGFDTHGHHTASALLAEAAFRAAADPHFRPDQLAHAAPWQARRLLWNKFLWNSKPGEDLSAYLKMDIGGYNPWLGLSYGEIAARSRSMHKSQGFGAAPSRGINLEYFQVLAGEPARHSIFEGLDLTWARVRGSDKLANLLRRARSDFRPDRPEAVIPVLLEARTELAALPSNPWKEQKRRELDDVLASCAGLWLEAAAADASAVPGRPLGLALTALNRSGAHLSLDEVRLPDGSRVAVKKPLPTGEPVQIERPLAVPQSTPYSNPYWLGERPEAGVYTVRDPLMIGLPESAPALEAQFVVSFGEQKLVLARPLIFKWTDPVAGERQRAVEIVPEVLINTERAVLMFPDRSARTLRVTLKASVDGAAGTLKPALPTGFKADPPSQSFRIDKAGQEHPVTFRLQPPAGHTSGTLRLVAEVGGKALSRGIVHIDHAHIPLQTVLPEAEVKLVRFDLAKAHTRIGYVPGPGDEVAGALSQVGYQVTMLDEEALASQPLGRFDAIVIGVRAFNTNRRLPLLHQKLMDYVAAGGTMVVQYNTNNRIGQAPPDIGPYPFEISQDRVTDENAAVGFALAEHALLRTPNRITAADFQGWVQERGLYFAGTWDPHYQTPLAMNDPGEPARKGSLLVARHGKGAFIYSGLAFFRQLPAGVPGAYRLLANLIAYGR
ncbi:MAG TPA: PIG-L family deacetylase [Polyangia bacterium]|nr:PIG-L family deacetylase [Polyangia bacterium]